VSSILDALEKLEARRTPGGGLEPPRPGRRTRTPLLAGAALTAFAAGIGLTVVWLRPTPEAGPAPASVTTAHIVPPSPPAAPPATVAPMAPVRAAEQPWGEVVASPSPRRVEAPPPPEARGPEPVATATPVAAPAPAARPAGAPAVRVSFLVYSNAPERRSVALTIDEAGLVTLREGEESNGLSVAQILPDGVELTWQDQSFTVRARN
jgi:hypothetical protein